MAEAPEAPPIGPAGAGVDPPAAPTEESPQENVRRRAREWRQTVRRATMVALVLATVGFSVRAIVGKQGFLEAHRSAVELARLEADVEKWSERNTALEARIKALRDDPAAIEQIARERLGWIKPGEVTFLFPHDPSAPAPGEPPPVSPGEFTPTVGDEGDASTAEDPAPPQGDAPAKR